MPQKKDTDSLTKKIIDCLESDASGESRKTIALQVKHKARVIDYLLPLLKHHQKNVRTRFTWLLGDIGEIAPELIRPFVSELFTIYKQTNINGFDRTLAKMFWIIGIPKEIEGEVLDFLFNQVQKSEVKVAVKVYAISAILELCKKYPELKPELKTVIEDQIEKNSIAFKVRAREVLKKL